MFWKRKGPHSPDLYVANGARCGATKAQHEGTDAVFHGACLGCLFKKGNSSGENLRYCLGCCYSDFSEDKPNRRLAEADERDFAADEAGFEY